MHFRAIAPDNYSFMTFTESLCVKNNFKMEQMRKHRLYDAAEKLHFLSMQVYIEFWGEYKYLHIVSPKAAMSSRSTLSAGFP